MVLDKNQTTDEKKPRLATGALRGPMKSDFEKDPRRQPEKRLGLPAPPLKV
jgi:hypothetical protein